MRGLGVGPGGDGRGRATSRSSATCAAELGLLLADVGGLGLQLLGVAAAALVLGLGREVPHALGRERGRAAQPLAQRDSRYQVSWARASAGRLAGDLGLQLGLAGRGRGELGLDLGAPLAQRGLVGHLLLERVAQRAQVVGEQPQPGVAQVGLDHRGAAGDLGLPPERLELAAQLGGEVLQRG